MRNLLKGSVPYLISLQCLLAWVAQAQLIPLPNEAKFTLGDNMQWAQPSFKDDEWKTQLIGASWSSADLKDSVYAWYRIKIIIPSSLRTLATNGRGIKLNLGKIDDVDQTFFNGKLIGQTGTLPPYYETRWDTPRQYIIPLEDVAWDEENVIAVRVYNGIGGAGMYEGPYGFGIIQWSDFISTHHIISDADSGFITKLKFVNNHNVAFDGTIKYWVADRDSHELFTETRPVHVEPIRGFESSVTFSNYQSPTEKVFKVGYEVIENSTKVNLKIEQIYLADKNIQIGVAPEPDPVVENKIKDAFTALTLQNIRLQGYLGKRLTQNLEERLLKIDEDGLMGSYLQRPGIHPWAGEHVGKYLETACNVWKNTKDARVKKQMDRMMFELINTQLPDGYLGTYTPDQYWTSWDVWSHKYNLYGLLAYYKTTGYQPALEACRKMGDLLCTTFGNNSGQRDIILAGTHMGMAATSVLDPMIDLYRYTGDKRYLDFCYYILDAWEHENGPKIISRLLATGQVNKVGNGKAYEMISNVLGLINLYRLTGDEKMLKPVLIAWQDIMDKRLYITGTTSAWEHFQEDNVLPAAEENHMGEGCVTTTWIQLNQSLFAMTGDLKYFNQIEKTIYNHLLGAENPRTGCVSYYTPLMDKKPYTCHITCCQSSIPRGIALLPNFTFGNRKNIPTLMVFEQASYKENLLLQGKDKIDLSLQVESNFPETGRVSITVNVSQSKTFSIALRVPYWCTAFTAKVGSKEYKGNPSEFLEINRQWKSGDVVKVSFDVPVRVQAGGKSYPDQIAFQRGPQILAFDDSLNDVTIHSFTNGLITGKLETSTTPNVLPKQWVGNQLYKVDVKIDKAPHQIKLVPFADASQTGGTVKVWLPFTQPDN